MEMCVGRWWLVWCSSTSSHWGTSTHTVPLMLAWAGS